MIVLDANVYSVPWQPFGAKVEVMTTRTTVSIHHRAKLVSNHPRCEGCHQRRMDKANFELEASRRSRLRMTLACV